MEKMNPADPIDFMIYKFHDKPLSLAGAKATVDVHPDFAKFMLDRTEQVFPNKSNFHALHERQDMFAHDATDAYWYATTVGGKISDAILKAIAKSPYQSVTYGMFTGERFREGEETLLNLAWHGNYSNAMRYVENVVEGRWPEFEQMIIKHNKQQAKNTSHDYRFVWGALPEYAGVLYKKNIQISKELMDIIKSYPKTVILYTFESGVRHEDLEPVIKADTGYWHEYWDTLYRHTDMPYEDVLKLEKQWKAELKASAKSKEQ